MKRPTKTLLLILITISYSYGQWEEKNISTDQTLTSLYFASDNVGYVTGSNQIFKTEDGGESWSISHTSNDVVFYEDVFMIDQNIIFAVGKDFDTSKSIISKSTDAGLNWIDLELSNSSLLRSVLFTSSNIGYCSGSSGTILKTIDGGENWEELITGISNSIISMHFINDSIGIAVGGQPSLGQIIKTQDGGVNWSIIESPSSNYLQSVFFTSQEIGYVVGWEGEILKTNDCGNSWEIQNSVSMLGNLEVVFTDANTGYITGGSQDESLIQKTSNGGEIWEDISPGISKGLISIQFPSTDTGYAVGIEGTVVKTDSGGVTSVNNLSNESNLIDLYPNPTSHSINIESKSQELIENIRIFDSNGRLISVFKPNVINYEINTTQLQADIYFFEIITKNSKTIRRIIKSK
jgi:photosystem II stability/assembly factor-like uncharacterized protein